MGFMDNLRDVVFEGDREKRRQQIVPMLDDLADRGLKPDEINSLTNQFIKTGQLDIPTRRERGVPFAPGTTDEVKFRKKAKQLYSYDPQANLFMKGPREDDNTDITVERMAPEKGIGYDIKVNRFTGAEISRTTNKEGRNHYIMVGTDPNGGSRGSGKDAPDVALAKSQIRKYLDMRAKDITPPDDFMDSTRSAADLLNLDLEEVESDPSMMDSIQNAAAAATDAIPGAPKVPHAKQGYTPNPGVRFKPKEGKVLTKELAQGFMQQAGGNKARARALAKKAGYTF